MFTNDRLVIKALKITGMVIAGIVFAVLMAFIFGYIFMRLWNWIMPDLFGFGTITFWQGFGLIIIAKILFGGFGWHHSHDKKKKRKNKEYNHLEFDNMADFMAFRMWKKNKNKKFDQYWQEEGKEAFEDYVKRTEDVQEKSEQE